MLQSVSCKSVLIAAITDICFIHFTSSETSCQHNIDVLSNPSELVTNLCVLLHAAVPEQHDFSQPTAQKPKTGQFMCQREASSPLMKNQEQQHSCL